MQKPGGSPQSSRRAKVVILAGRWIEIERQSSSSGVRVRVQGMSLSTNRRENPWEKNYGATSVSISPLDGPSLSPHSRYRSKAQPVQVQVQESDSQVSIAHRQLRKIPLGERLFGSHDPPSALASGPARGPHHYPAEASNSSDPRPGSPRWEESRSAGSGRVKRSTRHTPQTELQLLGTTSIWLLLLLPGIMTLLVLAIPAQYSMQVDRIPLSSLSRATGREGRALYSPHPHSTAAAEGGGGGGGTAWSEVQVYNCSVPGVRCQQFSLREGEDGEAASVNVLLHPERSVNSMGFLEVSIVHAGASTPSTATRASAGARRALSGIGAADHALQPTSHAEARSSAEEEEAGGSVSIAELSLLEIAVTSTVLDTAALVTIAQLLNKTAEIGASNGNAGWRAAQSRIGKALQDYHVDGASLGVLGLDLPSFLTRYQGMREGCAGGACHLQADVELPLLYTSFAPPNLGFSHYAQSAAAAAAAATPDQRRSRNLLQTPRVRRALQSSATAASASSSSSAGASQMDEEMGYSHWFQTMVSVRLRARNVSNDAFDDDRSTGRGRKLAGTAATDAEEDATILSRFFEDKVLIVVMQSEFFLLFDVVLRLALSAVTLHLYYIWWIRTWPHLRAAAALVENVDLAEDGEAAGTCACMWQCCGSCCSLWALSKRKALRMLAVLLPEQLTSVWMLFFLFVWQSPLSALISFSTLCGVKELPAYIVGVSVTTRSLAKYGLFFCALVYIEGLKFFPGDRLYGEEDEEDSLRKVKREANVEDFQTFQMLGANSQAGNANIFFQDMRGGGEESKTKAGGGRVFGFSDGEFTPFSPTCQRNSFRDRALDAATETGLTDAHGEPLTMHHVLSTDFLDFVWRKALILFLSWLSVFFFYQCQASAISDNRSAAGAYTAGAPVTEYASTTTQAGYSIQSVTMFIFLGLVSQLLLIYWILLLFLAARSTNRRLKRMSYSVSRFRQLAFRLFLWQFYLWLGCLLLVGVYRWRECMHIVKQQFGFFSTSYWLLFEPFGGLVQQIQQYFLGDPGVGSAVGSRLSDGDFSRMQLEALIYLSSDYSPPFGFLKSISLVSLSALCYTVAYTLTPPKLVEEQRGRSFAALPSLESDLPNNSDVHAWHADESSSLRNENDSGTAALLGHNDENTDALDDEAAALHAFIPMERDMPPLRSWNIFDSHVGSLLLQNPKLAYARLHMRMSASLQQASYQLQVGELRGANAENRGVTVHNVAQPFCLETACVLLEVSYQAYFRPAGEGFEVPASFDWGAGLQDEAPEAEAAPESAPQQANGANPFDEDTDDEDSPAENTAEAKAADAADDHHSADGDAVDAEPKWTRGPAMDLQRCNLRMLSTFYDTAYGNLGTVSQTDTPAAVATGEPVLPSRIVVCYRGTTEVKQAITDFKFHQAHLPDFRKTRSYFRRAVREKERQCRSRSRSATANKMPQSPPRPGSEFNGASTTAEGHPSPAREDLHYGSDGSPGYDFVSSPVSAQDEGDNANSAAAAAESAAMDLESGLEQAEEVRDAWTALADAGGWLRRIVSRLPILQHTLPLIHLGFKDMYMCIREQALGAVVHAMYTVRKQRRAIVLASPALQAALACVHNPRNGRSRSRSHSLGVAETEALLFQPLEVQFCGHSLGGVLAMLTAYDVSLNMPVILTALDDLEKADLQREQEQLHGSATATATATAIEVNSGRFARAASPRVLLNPNNKSSPAQCVEPYPHISMYSYGQPKPGNVAFCSHIASYLHTHYRVELDGDLITTIPPNYYRVYAHAGTQVIVDPHRAGTLVVNPSVVESYLLAGHHATMDKHAMERYRQCLLACFEPSELAQYLQTEYAAGSSGAGGERSRGGRPGQSSLERELASRLGIRSKGPTDMPGWMYK